MNIKNINVNQYSNHLKENSTSFNGIRQLIGSQSVNTFLRRTKILGDVVIEKRTENGENIPVNVSLVKTISHKHDENPKVVFALFEKGFENSETVEELDKKELGLAEVKFKNLTNIRANFINNPFCRSVKKLLEEYDKGLKLLYLVSHEGDKYRGIGTKLLDTAVAYSQQNGYAGKVFLQAANGIPATYCKEGSKYYQSRLYDAPTYFYYKYGFRTDEKINRMIQAGGKKCNIQEIWFYLPQEIAKRVTNSIETIKKYLEE